MIANGKGFDGTDEYDPAGDDHEALPKAAPHVRILAVVEDEKAPAAAVTLQRWGTEEKMLRVHTPERARVALRLLNYPAWRVDVNGRPEAPGHLEGTEQMVIQVPAGVSQIHVRFARTPDRTIGGAISLAALLAAAVLMVLAATSAESEGQPGGHSTNAAEDARRDSSEQSPPHKPDSTTTSS
jgi:hypothetical protein